MAAVVAVAADVGAAAVTGSAEGGAGARKSSRAGWQGHAIPSLHGAAVAVHDDFEPASDKV